MNRNPLLDTEFLTKLDEHREKEVFAKIIALTFDELPVEEITGKITSGGSINVDGTSAIRRSCSLSMVAKNVNINDFYWGLNSKFKLEIGLKNLIDNKYPEIIWFPQGTYLISSFSTSQSVNNYTIFIQGKDKMSLINGEIGGSLPHKTDFGNLEEIDLETNITTISKIPIKEIVREGVHEYAREPWHNIIINDLDDYGVELMNYMGSKPLYLIVGENDENVNEVINMTLNEDMECWYKLREQENDEWKSATFKYVADNNGLNKLNELYQGNDNGWLIKLNENSEKIYSLAQIIYGQTAGYRLTDIVYAGDLIANAGESFSSVLDKIVKMLGDFEYFYDNDGRFIFQRKKIYYNQSWNNLVKSEKEVYTDTNSSPYIYKFDNSRLITSFSNTPNLSSLKNDFAIWGQRTTASGAQVPIHLRYALDYKPTEYVSFGLTPDEANEYNRIFAPKTPLEPRKEISYHIDKYDWRELIYRMALDYRKFNHWDRFLSKIKEANPINFPTGYTGYEQYYIDMEGFWRQLYKPSIDESDYYFKKIDFNDIKNDKLYVKPLKKITSKDDINPFDCVVILKEDKKDDAKIYIETFTNVYCNPNQREITFFKKVKDNYVEVAKDDKNNLIGYDLNNLYIATEKEYILWVDSVFNSIDINKESVYLYSDEYTDINSLSDTEEIDVKDIYCNEDKYNKYYYVKKLRANGSEYLEANPIEYFIEEVDYNEDGWHKNVSDSPESLNFWFDFMDPMGELEKYAASVIGSRPKVVNETTIKAIYYRETPNVIFINKNNVKGWELTERKSGYTYIQIPETMLGLFKISSQGVSTQAKLEECLYNDTYCVESVSMNIIPIYYLQPNTKIYIKDDNSKINGEYSISRFTIPLTYNGTMSVSATKVADRLL